MPPGHPPRATPPPPAPTPSPRQLSASCPPAPRPRPPVWQAWGAARSPSGCAPPSRWRTEAPAEVYTPVVNKSKQQRENIPRWLTNRSSKGSVEGDSQRRRGLSSAGVYRLLGMTNRRVQMA
eukprot:8519452-Pyramimonas_sp.AAC.1